MAVRSRAAAEVKEAALSKERADLSLINKDVQIDKVLSTGSTLLDLAISGKRRRGGGIPRGILVELFGPSGAGKTALCAEICGNAQKNNGVVKFEDPEARLDQEYTQIYGVSLADNFDYARPDTVTEMFEHLREWEPKGEGIHVFAGDYVAALSTDLEMESGDKMGMRRAKEFSQELRKTCRIIAQNDWLVLLTNQIRQGDHGFVTPGGMGLPFYASLRIKVEPSNKPKIEKEVVVSGKKVVKVLGVNSVCTIVKSSVDEPFRTAPICITFNYGIDDIRANLQYLKDFTGDTKYDAIEKSYVSMNDAIAYIEDNSLESALKEKVTDLWYEIEEKFNMERKRKER